MNGFFEIKNMEWFIKLSEKLAVNSPSLLMFSLSVFPLYSTSTSVLAIDKVVWPFYSNHSSDK